MDKAPKKVTKDQTRVEAARKGRDTYMNNWKESILNDVEKVILPIQAMTLSAPSAMQAMKLPASPTPLLQDQVIIVSMGMLAFLAIGACVFFADNTFQLKI